MRSDSRASTIADQEGFGRRGLGGLAAWTMVLLTSFLVLTLPDHPDAITPAAFLRLPLELPILILLLAMVRGPAKMALRLAVTMLAGLILSLKLADIAVQTAFQRPFNPYLDAKMVIDGWNLFSGTVGVTVAGLIILTSILLVAALLTFYAIAMKRISRSAPYVRGGAAFAAGLLICIGAASLATHRALPLQWEAGMAPNLVNRVTLVAHSVADMAEFEAEILQDRPLPPPDTLFNAVKGRDVILIFIESYGRSAIEDPAYAPTIKPRLARLEQAFAAEGFSAASRWVTSPTVGGLSWLAHGSLLSGLWIDNQARYDRLMISERPSLNRLFSQAGWRSVAVMPAITMAWPEADYFGYDQVLAARDLNYRGTPFNWVTMPDQYTLSAFEKQVRAVDPRKPVMAEIALISSHAPWTPVPSLIDWHSVGDGTSFNDQAAAGPSPQDVWAQNDRVRNHYIRTIDYSLETLGSYITNFGKDALFILIGDHQPAALVTGPDASRDVPLHIVTRDAALAARFQAQGFVSGLTPRDGTQMSMSSLRSLLIDTLTDG